MNKSRKAGKNKTKAETIKQQSKGVLP
jgi:hypothetical protein